MGGFHTFALSFSIISILTGAVTLYGHGLGYGGPRVMSLGWLLVSAMTLCVALSMAELASALPTAGALYHWSSILGGKGWGWLTAWMNLLGQLAITASIDVGLAEFLAPLLGLAPSRATVLLLAALVLASHGLLNHVGTRVVGALNALSAWYHLAGVALVVLAFAALAPMQPASFLLQGVSHQPVPSYAYGFAVGLLQAQWTFTGYDASAHVSEETRDARRNAPWGIVLSVAVSAVAGALLLAAVTLSIQDLRLATSAPNAFIYVSTHALGARLGSMVVWVCVGAMWFCGLGSVTSCSRMLWAFARDGGVPWSPSLAAVSDTFKTPHNAVWTSVVGAFLVALWSGAYSVMTALSTLALYVSYALPVALAVRARRRGSHPPFGPWNLGRWRGVVNALALGWVVVVSVLFVLPPNLRTGYTFLGALGALGAAWALRERRRFRGPPGLVESG
ncbi:MAG: amino acid permease [Deltaproteobacteria bacterium]|nr:amino acid permease [Deltaproteobacteria bacterium]